MANPQGAETFENDVIFEYFRPNFVSKQFSVGAEGAEKKLRIWCWVSVISFIKSMTPSQNTAKTFFLKRACGALSLGPLFLRSEVGKMFSKSSQNPSKTPMFLISENQLINFQSTLSMFYVFHHQICFHLV